MYRSKRSGKFFKVKGLLLSLATVLMVFGLIGSSIAWLMTSTDPIVNVFTYGDIQIKLEETTGNRYKMTPGATLEKDPTLTVLADSEDCWLFVKIDESAVEKLSDYIDYSIADGWTALSGVPGVYYREVNSSDQNQPFGVLADNKVTVKGTVTKEMLEKLNSANYPTLTFTGYAVQRDATIEEIDTAAEAWALVSNP
jgi:hypothetical protein